jgi:hypothetical protein
MVDFILEYYSSQYKIKMGKNTFQTGAFPQIINHEPPKVLDTTYEPEHTGHVRREFWGLKRITSNDEYVAGKYISPNFPKHTLSMRSEKPSKISRLSRYIPGAVPIYKTFEWNLKKRRET